jgi:hypothetical protein
LIDPPEPHPTARSFLRKKNYGRNPIYLDERIDEQEKQEIAQKAQEEAEKNAHAVTSANMVLLPETERAKILTGLRSNWDRLNTEYQKLSLTVDTVPKIARYVNYGMQSSAFLVGFFCRANLLTVEFHIAICYTQQQSQHGATIKTIGGRHSTIFTSKYLRSIRKNRRRILIGVLDKYGQG